MTEQRRWPRIQLALDVRIQHDDLASLAHAKTLDVSREGMFLVAAPRPKGTKVRVHLTIGAEAMVLEGVVVHATESGMGVLLESKPAGWDALCERVLLERQAKSG